MRVAMVTAWGVHCGIADYSHRLAVEAGRPGLEFVVLAESSGSTTLGFTVVRCWDEGDDDASALAAALRDARPDVVHVQFQRYMSSAFLGGLIAAADALKAPVVVEIHALDMASPEMPAYARVLRRAKTVIVHQDADRSALSQHGIRPIEVLRLGIDCRPDEDVALVRGQLGLPAEVPIVGLYGFLLPPKGIREVIRSLPLVIEHHPDVVFVAACARHQQELLSYIYEMECMREARVLGVQDRVRLIDAFLPDAASMKILHAADVLALPYLPTKESASAAVRFAIASKRPVLVTQQPIFAEFACCTHQILSATPEAIAGGIVRLLGDPALRSTLVAAATTLCETMNWPVVAGRYRNILDNTVSEIDR